MAAAAVTRSVSCRWLAPMLSIVGQHAAGLRYSKLKEMYQVVDGLEG